MRRLEKPAGSGEEAEFLRCMLRKKNGCDFSM